MPELPMGLLVETPAEGCLALLESLRCVSIHCHHRHINADLLRFFHGKGYRVMVYTVNEVKRMDELLSLGIDGIFTDQLEMMAKRFPAQLRDAGKPMSDPLDDAAIDWLSVVPPMP